MHPFQNYVNTLKGCHGDGIFLFCFVGLFFILPCMDNIMTIDLRTITYDVPPQEVMVTSLSLLRLIFNPLFPFTVYPFTSSNEINLFLCFI